MKEYSTKIYCEYCGTLHEKVDSYCGFCSFVCAGEYEKIKWDTINKGTENKENIDNQK